MGNGTLSKANGTGRKRSGEKKRATSSNRSNKTVLAQVVALQNMSFGDLKDKYRTLYGKEPPSRSRKQLVTKLAYRIQEIALGGLSEKDRKRLTSIGEANLTPGTENNRPKERKGTPAIGTKLMREYLGETHEVVVLEKGFQYQGGVYRSLSAIAKEITGAHMSGPSFFGIAKKGASK